MLYSTFDMGLCYLIFKGINFRNIKKLMPVCMMNSATMNSTNTMNIAGIFKGSVAMTINFKE